MKRRWWLWVFVAVGLVASTAGGGAWYVHEGLRRASKLANFGLWADARAELDRFLWLFPQDDRAHVLYAEMLVKDESLDGPEAVEKALAHLAEVPDSAPYGPIARLQEGRITFLLLHQPTRAEEKLRHALTLDPELADAYRVLWKLYDQTGRSHMAGKIFREVHSREEWPDRVYRLREWYMSQFYPATANPTLDRLMGFVASRDVPTGSTEAYRFIRFRNQEPDRPLGYAALARWFQTEGDPQFALKTLRDGEEKMEGEERDPFYLHTLIGILIELGEYEEAGEVFDQWPEPHEGFEYWLSRAIVMQEVRSEFQDAADSYKKALGEWPGQVDWRTLNRMAICLARVGDQDGAERTRERAKAIEELMRPNIHQRIREALGFLNDQQKVREIEDFYRKLKCEFEAEGWREHLAQLAAGKSVESTPQSGGGSNRGKSTPN